MNKEFIEVDVDSISVKSSIRSNLGDLSVLEQSIKKLGLLSPVIIDTRNNLISGSRRLQACRNAGITRVPALKVNASSMDALNIQSDENLCRLGLSAEDLEKHIQTKKALASGKTAKEKGFFGWLKNIFS